MRIEVEITDEDAALIEEFMDDNQSEECCSHGPLDMIVLAEMLLHDVALVVRRPGSWEGANMSVVLASHGYTV